MAGPGEVSVRAARREDMALVAQLIKDLATFEGEPDGPRLTAEDLIRDGFECAPPWFSVVLAEAGGEGGEEGERGEAGREVVGYALVSRAYSSWWGPALYVEDVFVVEAWRRRGVATSLFVHLAQTCAREGRTRMDWHVLRDNPAANALYARLGARELGAAERRHHMRLYEPEILALAIGGRLLPALTHADQTHQ